MAASFQDILDYWFAPAGHAEHGQPRSLWFKGGEAADNEIRSRFKALHQWAATGLLDAWSEQAQPMLALVILLDQFSRHIYRGQAKSFAFDGKALRWAEEALAQGFDRQLGPWQRSFLYLPFEHAESLAAQERSIALYSDLAAEHPALSGALDYAQRHREIIARFGRFPHRNEILGRQSTPDEIAFLQEPGSRF